MFRFINFWWGYLVVRTSITAAEIVVAVWTGRRDFRKYLSTGRIIADLYETLGDSDEIPAFIRSQYNGAALAFERALPATSQKGA